MARACAGLVAAAAAGLSAGAVWYAPAEAHPEALAWSAATLVFVLVGAFVLAQRPRNVVGWLFVALGCTATLQNFGWLYASAALGRGEATAFVTVLGYALLTAHLLTTARATMAPVAASLWLHDPQAGP